jgi:hypothetical protein
MSVARSLRPLTEERLAETGYLQNTSNDVAPLPAASASREMQRIITTFIDLLL